MSIEQRLRDFAIAYPEDIFPPLSKDEVARLQAKGRHLLDRASAGMGRHFGPYALQGADRIAALEKALHEAYNEFENITVKNTLAEAQNRAHCFIAKHVRLVESLYGGSEASDAGEQSGGT